MPECLNSRGTPGPEGPSGHRKPERYPDLSRRIGAGPLEQPWILACSCPVGQGYCWMDDTGQSDAGGCRSFLAGGCLLALAAFCAAAAAFLLVLFVVMWLIQFVWSLM